MAMLDVRNLSISFGGLRAVDSFDLKIEKGMLYGLIGPNGAGKTTLLQIIGTLDTDNEGEVIINGVNIKKLSDKQLSAFRNKELGFVFQFHQLYF